MYVNIFGTNAALVPVYGSVRSVVQYGFSKFVKREKIGVTYLRNKVIILKKKGNVK